MDVVLEKLATVWDALVSVFDAELFSIGESAVDIGGILKLLLFIGVSLVISRLFSSSLRRISEHNVTLDPSVAYSIGRVSHYVILAAGFGFGLAALGLDLSNLAIVLGALGVGLGFGLQSIASNLASGLILLFEGRMKVGDFVELEDGTKGTIREINVRSTRMNTTDNFDVVVPNSEFIERRFTNWTLRDTIVRFHVPFGVAYGSDKDKVKAAAVRAANRVAVTVSDESRPGPELWLVGFGDSSLDFELVVWVDMKLNIRPGGIRATYMWEIETALREDGIQIPFPQRDLHIKTGVLRHREQGEDPD